MQIISSGKRRKTKRIVISKKKIKGMRRMIEIQSDTILVPEIEWTKNGAEIRGLKKLIIHIPNIPEVRKEAESLIKKIDDSKRQHKPYDHLLDKLHSLIVKIRSAKKYNKHFWGLDPVGWQKGYLNREEIKEILRTRTGRKNLDLASGSQSYIPENTTALDSNPDMLHYNPCKKKILFNLNSLGDKRKRIPERSNTYDTATINFGMNYFRNPIRVLLEAKRLIKPGGKIIILDSSESGRKEFAHRQFNPDQVINWLKNIGLETKIEEKSFGVISLRGDMLVTVKERLFIIEATKRKD